MTDLVSAHHAGDEPLANAAFVDRIRGVQCHQIAPRVLGIIELYRPHPNAAPVLAAALPAGEREVDAGAPAKPPVDALERGQVFGFLDRTTWHSRQVSLDQR